MTIKIDKNSRMIGVFDLLNDSRNGVNHLEGQILMTPYVGNERQKGKLSFDIRLDIKKIIFQYSHAPKGSKDLDIMLKAEMNEGLVSGRLKLKVSRKTGNRILEGWIGNIPLIGRENRRIKYRFHIEIDEERSSHLRNYNPDDAAIAEIEFKEVKPAETKKNQEPMVK